MCTYTPHPLYPFVHWQTLFPTSPCSVSHASVPDCWVVLVRWHCWVAAAAETSLHFAYPAGAAASFTGSLEPVDPSLMERAWHSPLRSPQCLGISIWTLFLLFCLQSTVNFWGSTRCWCDSCTLVSTSPYGFVCLFYKLTSGFIRVSGSVGMGQKIHCSINRNFYIHWTWSCEKTYKHVTINGNATLEA